MQHGCQGHDALFDALETLRGSQSPHALLSCSFRHYATVAAIHGHSDAEALFAAGQRRLAAVCPPGSGFHRLQADALAVVIPGPTDGPELLHLGERCIQSCRTTEQRNAAAPLLLCIAIGAALAEHGIDQNSQDLLQQAWLARIDAEQQRGSHLVLAPAQMQRLAAARYELDSALHLALEHNALAAALQPIVNLRDGAVIGFECLARWPAAQGASASPAGFLAAAHASGITAEIDLQVLRLALDAAPQLAAAAGPQRPLILSANLSGQLIESPRQVLELLDLIRSHPLPATVQLQLELLEEAFNNTAYDLDALLEWLAEQQVLIAIDDFGTGYSSLSRLHELTINTVKIDRSFVQRINAPHKPSNHLLQTLVAIGRDLQIHYTAEGVATDEQRRWLLDHGIEQGQGFLFSRPLSLDAAIDELRRAPG